MRTVGAGSSKRGTKPVEREGVERTRSGVAVGPPPWRYGSRQVWRAGAAEPVNGGATQERQAAVHETVKPGACETYGRRQCRQMVAGVHYAAAAKNRSCVQVQVVVRRKRYRWCAYSNR